MVSGLWHGASWTFVVWGALHGVMLLLERFFGKFVSLQTASPWLKALALIKTFLITSVIWIFFRAENFSKAKEIVHILFFNSSKGGEALNYWPAVIAAGALIASDALVYGSRFDLKLNTWHTWKRWSVYAILLFALFALAGTKKFAFIYFQF
jgi:alginate O-acetyltransferase complex protein AlgI